MMTTITKVEKKRGLDSEFTEFKEALKNQVAEMIKLGDFFRVAIDGDTLWDIYLESFPEGTNPIFRTRTEHDCSACRHFIKSFGNVVALKNNKIVSIWDFNLPEDSRYAPVVKALAIAVDSYVIEDIYATDISSIGVEVNFEKIDSGVCAWEHLHIDLPPRLINCTKESRDTFLGKARSLKDVFKRSLEEISMDSVEVVLELIGQNSLYKGEEWKLVLREFKDSLIKYNKLSQGDRDNFVWRESRFVGSIVGKLKNHSIGTLLVDISKGVELNEAVRKYESIIAPSNYKRPKAIFSQRMLKDAEKKITELGYLESLGRRYANLDDITVGNILFANRDILSKISGGNIFMQMAGEISEHPKNFNKIEEVPISKFVSEILPTVRSIEVLLENKHQSNLVSLIAPQNKESPSMFKWDNGFSWAYSGNITDAMKQRVKAAGGSVDGVLRFSIQWNEMRDNDNDFDAHCVEPDGNEIYFRNKRRMHPSSGMLDVDIIQPSVRTTDGIAVENITWSDKSKMSEGVYKMWVHNYNHRGGRTGFSAEIEFDGQVYSFSYNKELKQEEKVQVAEVIYSKKNGFSIVEKIPSSLASKKLWNLDTNKFHPVSVIMMSPNYWDGQQGIGNKHYFLMLKNCINPEQPNGFFNEYLKNKLLEHKRVFEALGSKMRVEPSENQLSGLGFSSTQRNSMVVRVEGSTKRVLKIVF